MLIMQTSTMSPTLGLFAREVLLEWFVDLFLGHWSGEHDLYGLGVLRGNNRARSVIHRTQQSTSGGGTFHGRPRDAGSFHFLSLQSPPPSLTPPVWISTPQNFSAPRPSFSG